MAQVIADRFEIERLAESGGMGSVYLARDRLTGEPVAVKLLARANERWAERFRREALALAELTHPSIVRYVAHGVSAANEPWLAMEWLDGEPLSVRLRRGRLSIAEGRDLGIRIAEALSAAHKAGVIHRDLKPANVFLVDGDVRQAKLLDFGVARLRTMISDTTRTGDKVGTPRYMAPEQVRAARAVDWRCDLWSLGCVLFTSLSGRPPFSAADEMATWGKILLEEAPPLATVRPDAPPALVALVRRLLEKVPELRPASAAAVADELRRIDRPEVADSTGITAVGASLATSSEHRRVAIVMVGSAADDDELTSGAREDTEPEAPVYVELAACAERYGGAFEALARGGAIITFAGSPSATDLVARAARCALDARRVCDGALALASGRGTVGTVPVGDAIDRAATLLRRAVSGTEPLRPVAIDEVTAALLGPRFAVDGVPLPSLVGERADDGVRVILGRRTPTVGRERELTMLLQACTDAADEPAARAVVVTGDAGIGKSRLRHELIERLEGLTEQPRIWIGRGDPIRAGSPFSLLGSALRRRIGAAEQLLTDEDRAIAAGCVAAAVDELELDDRERVTAFLSELVGSHVPSAPNPQLAAARRQPRLMSDQVRRAFLDFAQADAARRPLAWILDDLHWGDQPSIELIDEALRVMADQALAVIAFARPEAEGLFPRLWAQRDATQVRLGPLSRKAATRLVQDVLGRATPEPLVAQIVERAAGNAFYLEELVRAAAAGQVERLPESVVAMVQVRLEALPAPARQVLRGASVLGARFALRPLMALLGRELPEREVEQLLEDLVGRELLTREPGEEREWSFRHELYREAAYGTLLDADRRLAHRTTGLWLESRRDRDAFTVAQHLERGGELEKAAVWYRYAADQALEAGDPHAVIDRAARGIECGAADAERAQLLLLAAEAHDWLGETEATERCALEAMEVAREGSTTWLRAAAELAVAAGRQGNHHLLVGLARDMLRVRAGEARADRVVSFALVASELLLAGHGEQGGRLMARLEELADVCARDPLAAGWRARARGIEAVVRGDSVAALALMIESATCMEQVGAQRDLVAGLCNIGFLEIMVGRAEEAETTLARAQALAEAIGAVRAQTMATQNLALAVLYRGRGEDALALARAAEKMARSQGSLRVAGASAIYQARALILLGRAHEARVEATRAVDLLAGIPPTQCYALAVRAESELALERLELATTAARACERLLDELGAIDEGDGYVRMVLARVLFARGDTADATRVARAGWARVEAAAAGLSDPAARASFLAMPEHVALRKLAE
ncbi:MAG: protein kinase [Myxococcales bacterium]|nr:protein kinase [Myxococcales bacterium]